MVGSGSFTKSAILEESNAHFKMRLWKAGDVVTASQDVVRMLDKTCARVGYPKAIRVDQGSEFVFRDLDLWAYQNNVVLDFSQPGKPTDNAFTEAFNGRFRAVCLNAHAVF